MIVTGLLVHGVSSCERSLPTARDRISIGGLCTVRVHIASCRARFRPPHCAAHTGQRRNAASGAGGLIRGPEFEEFALGFKAQARLRGDNKPLDHQNELADAIDGKANPQHAELANAYDPHNKTWCHPTASVWCRFCLGKRPIQRADNHHGGTYSSFPQQ